MFHIIRERLLELNHRHDRVGGCGCVGCAPSYHEALREEEEIADQMRRLHELAQRLALETSRLPWNVCERVACFAGLPVGRPCFPAIKAALGVDSRAARALERRDHTFVARLDEDLLSQFCVVYSFSLY